MRWARLALPLLLAAALAGCGGEERAAEEPSPAPPAATTAPEAPGPTTTLTIYFTRGEQVGAAHRVVPKTETPGAAAMEALLAGPTRAEAEAGLGTVIPEGTRFLGLSIEGGVATVDLSREFESGGGSLSMRMRIAQVVHTLTFFPTVEKVAFRLGGEPVEAIGGEGVVVDPPVDRADFEDLAPAILVESPAVGDSVTSPLRLRGTANTFEATFMIRLEDAQGRALAEDFATATSGSGTRGTFDVTLPFEVAEAGPGTLVVFESSAKDGSPIHVVEIPLELEP